MAEAPVTRPSLLVRLRDPRDQEAWRTFLDLYGPVIYRFARKNGLQDADAADVTQAVLQAVSTSIGRLEYDPARGTFRGWLFGVVRRQLGKWRERSQRHPQGSGDTAALQRLAEQPAPADDAADLWEQEYQRQRFLWAAQRVRGRVPEAAWLAFWQTTVDGRSATDVAQEQGLSLGALYTAKSRVLAQIRQEIQGLETDE
jgi:RNA polymerase sigma factor (sigma-70 family)